MTSLKIQSKNCDLTEKSTFCNLTIFLMRILRLQNKNCDLTEKIQLLEFLQFSHKWVIVYLELHITQFNLLFLSLKASILFLGNWSTLQLWKAWKRLLTWNLTVKGYVSPSWSSRDHLACPSFENPWARLKRPKQMLTLWYVQLSLKILHTSHFIVSSKKSNFEMSLNFKLFI